MRKTPVFRFLPLRWWDLLIYAAFIGLFVYTYLGIDFQKRVVSADARFSMVWTSLIPQLIVLQLLCSWIKNTFNFLFLLAVGCAFLWLFFAIKDFRFESMNYRNAVLIATWLPFLFVLQLFRIVKLNLYGEELAVPVTHRSALFGEAKAIDVICCIVGYFMILGVELWTT